MPSETRDEAYVWIWLPGETAPVVAGLLSRSGADFVFNYGQSYLRRDNAIPIYDPELPLKSGRIPLLPGLSMPNCIRDASPDVWGRRVIHHRSQHQFTTSTLWGGRNLRSKFRVGVNARDPTKRERSSAIGSTKEAEMQIDELTYLLESGSDRAGALDFQNSPTEYVPRQAPNAPLEELLQAAERVEAGLPLTPELEVALLHGSSLGGARPKALIESDSKKYVAKFSSRGDVYNVVKAEFIAMRLAAKAGLRVASVQLTQCLGKDVLLIERFDRHRIGNSWGRRAVVSALTLLELDEMMARYASYETLAEIVRHRFADAKQSLRELFGRMVFNILCGNIDDHARNHAAFWDGNTLSLTPAYDICPQARTGQEASQAMLISGDKRASHLALCLESAPAFLLNTADARAIIDQQIACIEHNWDAVCDEAELPPAKRKFFWTRQFLNPFAFQGYSPPAG